MVDDALEASGSLKLRVSYIRPLQPAMKVRTYPNKWS